MNISITDGSILELEYDNGDRVLLKINQITALSYKEEVDYLSIYYCLGGNSLKVIYVERQNSQVYQKISEAIKNNLSI